MDLPTFGFGFYHCTITKTLIVTSITSFFVLVFILTQGVDFATFVVYNPRSALQLSLIWKFVTSKFGFYLVQTLFLGTLLLYTFKVFEQRMGARKYISFIIECWLISCVLDVFIAIIFNVNTIAPGMYWLIFALAVKFYYDIPVIEQFPLLGSYRANQKTITYVLLFQLALADSYNVSVITGLIAGLIYHHDLLHINKWFLIPNFLFRPTSSLFGSLLSSKPAKFKLSGATAEVQRQMQMDELERRFLQQRFMQTQR